MSFKKTLLSITFVFMPILSFAQGEFSYNSTGSVTCNANCHYNRSSYYGFDIGTGCGGNIGAARGGTIISAYYSGGCGNMIRVDHSYGYVTKDCHLSSFVRTGGSVSRNTIIGKVGTTGNSSGCHNHLEIARNGVTQYIPGSNGAWVSLGQQIGWDYPGIHN